MGPLAGIGDTLSQSTITPILLALGIGIAGEPPAAGPSRLSVPAPQATRLAHRLCVLISTVIVGIGYTAWMQGYSRGRAFVTDLLRSGTIDRVLVGAGVLGNLVLGALAAKYIVVYLAPTVTIAGAQLTSRPPSSTRSSRGTSARPGPADLVAAAAAGQPLACWRST